MAVILFHKYAWGFEEVTHIVGEYERVRSEEDRWRSEWWHNSLRHPPRAQDNYDYAPGSYLRHQLPYLFYIAPSYNVLFWIMYIRWTAVNP
jgi:hypothetical protein